METSIKCPDCGREHVFDVSVKIAQKLELHEDLTTTEKITLESVTAEPRGSD